MKDYVVKFETHGKCYTHVMVSGKDMSKEKAERKAVDYANDIGMIYVKIDEVYQANKES